MLEPTFVPLVSVNLDGLLILTNIVLGLLKLNFFSLRKNKNTSPQPPVTVSSSEKLAPPHAECPGCWQRRPGPGLWLPVLSLPGPGAPPELWVKSQETNAACSLILRIQGLKQWPCGLGSQYKPQDSQEREVITGRDAWASARMPRNVPAEPSLPLKCPT